MAARVVGCYAGAFEALAQDRGALASLCRVEGVGEDAGLDLGGWLEGAVEGVVRGGEVWKGVLP